tara:strand:- start:4803 stop:5393 length:591 start_codon:yes stop_codon:yes gene_type:complete
LITETRKEYKRIVNISETMSFLKKNEKKLIEIHEPRIITSLYFDTFNFSLYKSSIEKDVDTYKVRVRTYSNNKKFFKEVKKNMFSGKYKLIEQLDVESFNDLTHFFVNGNKLYPTLFTEYKRRYFNLDNNCRITLDTDIHFTSHKYRTPVKEKMNYLKDILEFKQLETNLNIEKYIDKNPVAFSKYKYGIKKVYGI